MNNIFILYHDDSDGIASALAAHVLFQDNATYLPVQYNQPFPDIELTKDTHIYIVDFSYSRQILEEVNAKVGQLQVIDHHKTAKDELADLPYALFDMKKSGAVLAWEFFHPQTQVPEMMLLVEDRDLWLWLLPDSRAFEEGMKSSGGYKNLKYWAQVLHDRSLFKEIIIRGHLLLEPVDKFIAGFIKTKKYKLTTFRGHKIALYNTPTLISELGSALNLMPELGIDYTLSYFFTTDGEVVLSFRSTEAQGVDVSAIAKSFGGGGHEQAAGVGLKLIPGLKLLEELYA